MSKWDFYCSEKADTPSKGGWVLLGGVLVVVLILAVCISRYAILGGF